MDRTKRTRQGSGPNVKPKMTREQMQLAIIKKKECDSKALKIVEQLLEPNIDIKWIQENLKNINRCHMEDVIEERAITKLCGYILCQKPITHVVKQRWSISLKEKKVYDVTKRKNFCSSSCFGASNYLLEQMLTSPLWMRDKEEVPTFRIFSEDLSKSRPQHGDELDIQLVEPCSKDDDGNKRKMEIETSDEDSNVNNKRQKDNSQPLLKTEEVSGNIEDFVSQTLENMNLNSSEETLKVPTYTKIDKSKNESELDIKIENSEKKIQNREEKEEVIVQRVHFVDTQNIGSFENTLPENCDNKLVSNENKAQEIKDSAVEKNIVKETSSQAETSEQRTMKNKKVEKRKSKTKNQLEDKNIDSNLAAQVEQSFHEWVSEKTIHFLFGGDFAQQIEKIERQDRYSILCEKLNKLQFEDEQEDTGILQKPVLKPAPHFDILKEEGQKLQLKVNAFYEGNLTFEEPEPSFKKTSEDPDSETILPLTEAHAPNALRRKIFLEKLDQVVPDLIRTLAGNNEMYAGGSDNYSSLRCTTVKALVHTFLLSPKNITFKTVEWTLVGLVIIKMLSLMDPWLANLLGTKQANMYISMILAFYKLNPDYLSLFVSSLNKNMAPS